MLKIKTHPLVDELIRKINAVKKDIFWRKIYI